MTIGKPYITGVAAVTVFLAGMPGTSVRAETNALQSCMQSLGPAIVAIGEPRAGEVYTERNEVRSAYDGLKPKVGDISAEYAQIEAGKQKLDRANRERDDKLRQIEFEEKVLVQEWENLNHRRRLNSEDALKHQAAAAATDPTDEAAAAVINEWARRGNEIRDGLLKEKQLLEERTAALKLRRDQIAQDIVQHAQWVAHAFKYRSRVDREMTTAIRECSALLTRATALRLIANAPERAIEYKSQDAIAEEFMKDMFKSAAKETGVTVLKSKWGVSRLAKLGLSSVPLVNTLTVADIAADAALMGANQREREVLKNIYLIGDYAYAMKQIVKEKGKGASQSEEYKAIVSELKRLQADMPKDEGDFLWESVSNVGFFAGAMLGVANKYVSKKAGKQASKITNHLNNMERETLGKGGVAFFREASNITAKANSKAFLKSSAHQASDAYISYTQTPIQAAPALEISPSNGP